MKKNSKERLFEVMGRLDKTFKPKLNEGFEEIEATDDVEVPAEMGAEEVPAEEPVEEKSPEEKLAELTAKVDEMYALLHGEGGEEPAGEPEEIEMTTGEIEPENLQEWNFDKKKGEKEDEKDEEGKEHEKKESPEFEKGEEEGEEEGKKEEEKELDEEIEAPAKPKIPVAAVAKVGK